jgi:protein-S-isoprenylcysteine O-methyltransferase Ste14
MLMDRQSIGIIIGIILTILGFILFASISLANSYPWMNLKIHIFIVSIGLILISIAIILFYFCTKNKRKNQSKKSS